MSNKLIGAAAIITDSEGRVLLVRHSYGRLNWDLPGGKAEANESAQETAQREVLEETGIVAAADELTGIYYDPRYDMHHFVFRARHDGTRQPEPCSPEILECGYFAVDDLPRPMKDFTYNRIMDAFRSEEGDRFHVIGPVQWIE
ncbi:NUDIX domain-containing protein [Paenibacillus soyae]|uniref:NUDIX domain-containing protein n=1 Tax=Paenibacillus soyae TaxID=2969249 RepID=A0A9X2MQW3_9BACL|nr:NUDIX domain-containing protein [Paenibacillus soyae]MCR2805194.1 NUDIX domain-containing protein [Paenibacillus soyae]